MLILIKGSKIHYIKKVRFVIKENYNDLLNNLLTKLIEHNIFKLKNVNKIKMK